MSFKDFIENEETIDEAKRNIRDLSDEYEKLTGKKPPAGTSLQALVVMINKAKDELNEAVPGMGNAHGFARSIKDLKDIKKMTQLFKDGRGVQAEYITVADEQFKVYIEFEGKVK